MSSRYVLVAAVLVVAAVAVSLGALDGIASFAGSQLVGVRAQLAAETASNVTSAAFRGDAEALSSLFGRELTPGQVAELSRAVPPSVGGDRGEYEISLPGDQDAADPAVTVLVEGRSGGIVTLVDLEWDGGDRGWRPTDLRSAYLDR